MNFKMNKILKTICSLAVATSITSSISTSAFAEGEDFKRFYVGGGAGISKMVYSTFKDKSSGTAFILKKPTQLFYGNLGYKVTEDIMVEFSYENKPKYPAVIQLSKKNGGKKAKTSAIAELYLINFIYNLQDIGEIKPYFLIGGGYAKVRVKSTGIASPDLAALNIKANEFAIRDRTSDCLAWQIGVGASKNITEDLSIRLGAKLQVVPAAHLNVKYIDEDATKASLAKAGPAASESDVVYKERKIKKMLGAGEITLGFNYSLPF